MKRGREIRGTYGLGFKGIGDGGLKNLISILVGYITLFCRLAWEVERKMIP